MPSNPRLIVIWTGQLELSWTTSKDGGRRPSTSDKVRQGCVIETAVTVCQNTKTELYRLRYSQPVMLLTLRAHDWQCFNDVLRLLVELVDGFL